MWIFYVIIVILALYIIIKFINFLDANQNIRNHNRQILLTRQAETKQRELLRIASEEFQLKESQRPKLLITGIEFSLSETSIGKYLIIDTETTGLPKIRSAHPSDHKNFPRIVQMAWIILDENRGVVKHANYFNKECTPIPPKATNIHGITNDFVKENGIELKCILDEFINDVKSVEYIVAHNIAFDIPIIES